MACNCQNQKSCVRTYNNTTQTVTTALTQLTLLGNTCTQTGCSIVPNANNITVNTKGLYYISADVTFTPTAAGTAIFQIYDGATALPCAIAQETAEAANAFTVHMETELVLCPCCNVTHALNVRASGVAGGVNYVAMLVRKDA